MRTWTYILVTNGNKDRIGRRYVAVAASAATATSEAFRPE
jgi:hypothetical protein